MIFDYGFSIQGKSHVLNRTECQDAFCIRRLENGWYVGAAADGVGSCENAAVGSTLAVKTLVDFICECMPYDDNLPSIKSMLRTAYNYALKTILNEADEENPAESFETTLSVVLYDGKRVIYAHCGDGAILGLNTFGELVEIAAPQKGEDGISVIPLRKGYRYWEIDVYEEDLAAVFLVTDGMLDALKPYLMRLQSDASGECPAKYSPSEFYVPLGLWFADPAGIPKDEKGICLLKEEMEAFVKAEPSYDRERFYERLKTIYRQRVPQHAEEYIDELKTKDYARILMDGCWDDKTVAGFINTEVTVDSQPEEYYKEPDWDALQEIWDQKAYPAKYRDTDETRCRKWLKKWTCLLKPNPQGQAECEVQDGAELEEN